MMLSWLPLPLEFRAALKSALQESTPVAQLDALAQLANHRLSFLELIQLDNALSRLSGSAVSGFSPVRVAILGSATLDHLAGPLRVAGLRRRLRLEVFTGGYGQYRQELLEPRPALRQFGPDIVILSLTAREVLSRGDLNAGPAEIDASLDAWIGELRSLWRAARESLKATVIQQTFLNVADPLFGSYDRLIPGSPRRLIARLNERVAEAAQADGVLLLDVAQASERDGLDSWFDQTRWLQGKFEIAHQAAPTWGELAARIIGALRGVSKKCLVLDLDNTLWGGVIGDDGIAGIVLGEGSAAGEAYLALQRYAKQLRERGIVLAVCSKNDPAIAEAAFRDHPEMVLKRSDIIAFVANWDDKSANLQLIARQLNLGLDSLVFLDDNPAERARVRQSLPMVGVPELPSDPAGYLRCLADAGYFEAISFTADDRKRSGQYAANEEREALLKSSASLDDFLDSLDMAVGFGAFSPVNLERVVQLINKTNQFNPTTRRYTPDHVAGLTAAGDSLTLQFRLLDRFGDNGLVSAMILTPEPGEPGTMAIDTWVMSCRVFGRQLEQEAMNIAVETAGRLGVRSLVAEFRPTAKNGVVKDLYPTLGFQPDGSPEGEPGASRWRLQLADYTPRPTHIVRRPETND